MTMTGPGQDVDVEPLQEFFARTPKLAVAFSGGSDSAYLLTAAHAAGVDVKAYIVRTAFQPVFEMQDAQRLVDQLGVPYQFIEGDVLQHADICANGPDRCYRCKTFVFSSILAAAQRDGYPVLADGTNTTDDPANRPGFQALAELGVVSPLRRAGLSKQDVRDAARALGVFTADKPSFSCLAVHVPAGQRIDRESLDQAFQTSGAADIVHARAAANGDA